MMPSQTQEMLYSSGQQSKENFISFCKKKGLSPKKVVFIFPGNPSHHQPKVTLFSQKSGGGLAAVAHDLGDPTDPYPVLSLPTTGAEKFSSDEKVKQMVNQAIADIYRAVGAGYSVVLPVRSSQNDRYFSEGLAKSYNQSMVPSFWGNINVTPNPQLAQHYLTEINALYEFVNSTQEEREMMISNTSVTFRKQYYDSYELGQTTPDDLWFKTPHEKRMENLVARYGVSQASADLKKEKQAILQAFKTDLYKKIQESRGITEQEINDFVSNFKKSDAYKKIQVKRSTGLLNKLENFFKFRTTSEKILDELIKKAKKSIQNEESGPLPRR